MRPAAHPPHPLIAAESEGKALEEIVAAADASHVDPRFVDTGARQWEEAGVIDVVVVLEEIVTAADASHVDTGLVDAGARQWEEARECFFDLDNLLLGRGLLLESSNLVDIGFFPSDCSTFG